MAVLAQPQNLYSDVPAGTPLPQHVLNVGNTAMFVLEARGTGTGALTLESTLADFTDRPGIPTPWEPLAYSLTQGGPLLTGEIEIADKTKIWVNGPLSGLRVNGAIQTGVMSLWYFGTPFVFSGGASGSVPSENNLAGIEDALDEILDALASQPVQLFQDLAPVGALNPLSVKVQELPAVEIAPNQTVGLASAGSDVQIKIVRPANMTAYSANDAIGLGNTGTAVLVFQNMLPATGGDLLITSTELEYDVTSLPAGMANCTLYLYSASPPSAFGDNGAWTPSAADQPFFLGKIALGTPVALAATILYVQQDGVNVQRSLPGPHVYAYLVTDVGFTPAANSEVLKVTLHALRV